MPHALADSVPEVKPSPRQVARQDLEFGVIVHFGTNTFLDREWGDGIASPKVFNSDQWIPRSGRAPEAAGDKSLLLVAKHHGGFSLYPSPRTGSR